MPYHVPVTRVEFDPLEQAGRAVEIMMDLLRGREPSQNTVVLPGTLVEGATS